MKAFFILLMLNCVSVQAQSTISAPKKEDFTLAEEALLERDGEDVEWELKFKGEKFAELKSIGGIPEIERMELIESKKIKGHYLVIYYDGGTAGTKAQTRLDRMLVLWSENGGKWRTLADEVIGLQRFLGEESLGDYKRTVQWDSAKMNLKLGALDEYSPAHFTWSGKDFVRR